MYFFYFSLNFRFFGLRTVFFELLHAKLCRITWNLHQKVGFGSETCKIERKHVFYMHFFLENVGFDLQTTFFHSFAVLLSFLVENDTERI